MKMNYGEAICDAFRVLLEKDKRVFLIGVGVNSPWYFGNTTKDLFKLFGGERVIDIPISENCITGVGVGAALCGMRPIVLHPRNDFVWLAMDPIVNSASTAHYMFGGKVKVPLVIRTTINRGGSQASQHSQALQAIFAHIPGLKVVMPSTAYDAKGLLIAAVRDNSPVIYIDDRWLYENEGNVPEEEYVVPIGKAIIRKEGKDITIIGTSFMAVEAEKAGKELNEKGIDAEIIDLRTVKPLDTRLILESVKKTGRLVIADASWRTGSIASEISALVSEELLNYLKAPIVRITLPDCHAPANEVLEDAYYLSKKEIIEAVLKMMGKK
jgi:pyruvate dehydrogenase E1 component beta subunit